MDVSAGLRAGFRLFRGVSTISDSPSPFSTTSTDPSCSRGGGGKKGTYSSELVGGRDALADELLEELDVERRVVS